MSLFDIDVPESTKGWQNLKAAESQTEAWIKVELEKLWQSHEPFADDAFDQSSLDNLSLDFGKCTSRRICSEGADD